MSIHEATNSSSHLRKVGPGRHPFFWGRRSSAGPTGRFSTPRRASSATNAWPLRLPWRMRPIVWWRCPRWCWNPCTSADLGGCDNGPKLDPSLTIKNNGIESTSSFIGWFMTWLYRRWGFSEIHDWIVVIDGGFNGIVCKNLDMMGDVHIWFVVDFKDLFAFFFHICRWSLYFIWKVGPFIYLLGCWV